MKVGNLTFTESTTIRTSDHRRLLMLSRRTLAVSAWNRGTRLRAAFLAAVWMLPGVWCAAHTLAHEIEAGHHELHVAVSPSAGIPAMSCDHDHTHSHPEAPPMLGAEGAKKLDALALLPAAVEIAASKATLYSRDDTALGYAARRAAAISGPRAPPIS